jgi:hypothetical protein
MPKYIIPFVDKNKWQTINKNPLAEVDDIGYNCPLCEVADDGYKKVLLQTNSFVQQKQINELENVLVDGYNLLTIYEKNGFAIYKKDDIEKIKLYTDVNDLFMQKVQHYFTPSYPIPVNSNIDMPVLNHSRWCKYCGSRKPDIYNSTLVGDNKLTSILNFKIELNDNKALLNWTDITANNWYKSKVIKKINNEPLHDNDGDIISEYTNINKFEINSFVDEDIIAGNVYYYQVYSYDILDNVLCATQIVPILIEDKSYNSPGVITGFHIEQKRHIEFLEDNTPFIQDYIISTWNNNQDYDGVILKYDYEYNLPITQWDGKDANIKMLVNVGYNNSDLLLGNMYCVKPFPYKNIHYVNTTDGIKYINSKDYNSNSKPSYIKIQQHIDLPTNINLLGEDNRILLNWEDPDDLSWIATKIYYKKNSMITSEDDPEAILVDTITIKNSFLNIPFHINNIINGIDYYVGIFPVNNNGLCNVNIDNQKMINVSYSRDDMIINLDNLSTGDFLLNYWYVDEYENVKVLRSSIIPPDDINYISIFQNLLKYGAVLTFNYIIHSYESESTEPLNVIINGDKIAYYGIKKTLSGKYTWSDISIDLPATDYLNIKFQFMPKSKNEEDYVMVKDIRIIFNKK